MNLSEFNGASMNIAGIPYFGNNNQKKIKYILEKDIGEYRETDLYSLLLVSGEKNSVVIIDNRYLTWIEDIQLNYRDKIVSIPYYTYKKEAIGPIEEISTEKSYYDHIEIMGDNMVNIKYEYELMEMELRIGTKLVIYNVKNDEKIEYNITRWANTEFSISKLYELYKQYCYYDMQEENRQHEGGYTYISKNVEKIYNKEEALRKRYKLKTYKEKRELKDYRDVRIYRYDQYISRVSNEDKISEKLFKYRKLDFESYLFCNLRENNKPVDCCSWDELGKSRKYIKVTDGHIPFFIKHEWLNTTEIKSNETWRHLGQ